MGLNSEHSDKLPPHLSPLVESEWAVWRWFVLRGAGFPARLVTRLSMPLCASAADSFVTAEAVLENCFQTAIGALNLALDQLTADGIQRGNQAFKSVLSTRRRLADRKLPEGAFPSHEFAPLLEAIRSALNERDRARVDYENAFTVSIQQQCETLRGLASDPRFQEAVAWQNCDAFETAVRPMVKSNDSESRNQRQRHHEEMVASYVQRYCVKNDTIGFFGPVAWGKIEPESSPIEINLGAHLIGERHTYFEGWPINEVAAALSLIDGMQWWIPPRLAPDISFENSVIYRTGALALAVTELEAAVLRHCNGTNLPVVILKHLHENPEWRSITKQSLVNLLRAKEAEGILVWRFLVPVIVNSENSLREQLLNIGDSRLRGPALALLDELEAARKRVSDAAGNADCLAAALESLEKVFESGTNVSSRRNAGATYGGRTIVYEDCKRDTDLRIAPGLLAPIIPALSLVLQSLRWLVQSISVEFVRLFHESYREIVRREGKRNLPLMDWWAETEPRLLRAESFMALETAFRRKWAEILEMDLGQRKMQFESRTLRERVSRLFPELGYYHPIRYFCPDMMLAAESVEAIRMGEALYVLGEVHAGKNTLCHTALVEQHPDTQELIRATEWDLGDTCFKILNTQQTGTTTVRTSEGLWRSGDYYVATTPDAVAPDRLHSFPISQFMIRERKGELEVVCQADGRRFHILEAFSDLFSAFVMNKASWIEPSRHVPRVLIDNLVLHREMWRFGGEELAFALEKTEKGRFLASRRWAGKEGLPQYVFVKSNLEVKPFYVDMESPILVEVLCRAIRRMNAHEPGKKGLLSVSEMLPGLDGLWLQDGEGARYTSELRFAVVDLKARFAIPPGAELQ